MSPDAVHQVRIENATRTRTLGDGVLIGPGSAVTAAAMSRDAGPVVAGPVVALRTLGSDAPVAAEVVEVLGSDGLALLEVAAPGFDVPFDAAMTDRVRPSRRSGAGHLLAGSRGGPLAEPAVRSLTGAAVSSPAEASGSSPTEASGSSPAETAVSSLREPSVSALGEPAVSSRPEPEISSPAEATVSSLAEPESTSPAEAAVSSPAPPKIGGGIAAEGEGSTPQTSSERTGGTRRTTDTQEHGALLLAYLKERARTGRLDPVVTVPALEGSR